MRHRKPEELKEADIEWVSEIPKGWNAHSIKSLAKNGYKTFVDGDWVESNYITDSGVRLIQTGNIGVGEYKEQGFRYITEDSFEELGCTEIETNDILICRLAEPVGRGCLAPDLGVKKITSVDVCILKPSRNFDERYVVYALSSKGYLGFAESISRGSTRERISRTQLGNLKLPIPSQSEQRSIAAFLDRKTEAIDRLIQKKEQLIERLKEKRQALITQAVTKGLDPDVPMKDSGIEWLGEIPKDWEITKVKWLVSKIGSGKTPRGGSEVYEDEGIPFLRSQNIHFDGLRLDDVVYINEEIHQDMISTAIKPKDVLLNITGASIGRASLIPEDFPKANLNQHVCILRPRKESISPDYLHLVVSSDIIQNQIFAFENGTSREGLNFSQVGSLLISLPSISEQQKIVRQVREYEDRIFSLWTGIENQIEKLKEYRQSLISAAVTGKVDVREEVEVQSV